MLNAGTLKEDISAFPDPKHPQDLWITFLDHQGRVIKSGWQPNPLGRSLETADEDGKIISVQHSTRQQAFIIRTQYDPAMTSVKIFMQKGDDKVLLTQYVLNPTRS